MFYAINAQGTVLYRSKDKSRVEAHVASVAKVSGVTLRISNAKPTKPTSKIRFSGMFAYNDPIEM